MYNHNLMWFLGMLKLLNTIQFIALQILNIFNNRFRVNFSYPSPYGGFRRKRFKLRVYLRSGHVWKYVHNSFIQFMRFKCVVYYV